MKKKPASLESAVDPVSEKAALLAMALASDDTTSVERYKSEGNVRADLSALLAELGCSALEQETEYAIPGGSIDVYVPARRVVIETKSRGHSDPNKPRSSSGETPKEQLDRYMQHLVNEEIQKQELSVVKASNQDWLAVHTDGTHWNIYRYPHVRNPRSFPVSEKRVSYRELIKLLRKLLDREKAGPVWIPENPGKLFRPSMEKLKHLYGKLPKKARRQTQTKLDLWRDMLKVAGMLPGGKDPELLFVAHTFLVTIARLVGQAVVGSTDTLEVCLKNSFASWVLDFQAGRNWAKKTRVLVETYDWRSRSTDVMRSLYMDFVAVPHRKVFGEFYTPDWLAEFMVREILDDEWLGNALAKVDSGESLDGIGLLDPACGSGTFLYHAARRIRAAAEEADFPSEKVANAVAGLLHGLDVHPVAVEIARTNILRVLPGMAAGGLGAISIRIGDSLIAGDESDSIFRPGERVFRLTTPRGGRIDFPIAIVLQASFPEDVRRLVNAAAKGEKAPPSIRNSLETEDQELLDRCMGQLQEVIEKEGDSVWTWYAVNIAAARLLSIRKVDRIVANPPWVKLSDIQNVERKRVMETLGRKLKVHSGGIQAPHTDIASFFVLRARHLYLADPDKNPAAWLVKKSALHAGHWADFRKIHKGHLTQSIDLEQLQPFGGGDSTRSCLLLEHLVQTAKETPAADHLVATRTASEKTGRPLTRPGPQEPWTRAVSRVEFRVAPKEFPPEQSQYSSRFKQGATLVPHCLVAIASHRPARQRGRVLVTTRKSTQKPWKDIGSVEVEIPEHWQRPCYRSSDTYPFNIASELTDTIIPVDGQGRLLPDPGNKEEGWTLLDESYQAYMGEGKSTPKTLGARINFGSALSRQLEVTTIPNSAPPSAPVLVVYPASGDNFRASRACAGSGIVDSTLYWHIASDAQEAAYLTTIFNAACLKQAFKESRSSGRDFHLYPVKKVPIPQFDAKNPVHKKLWELCEQAEEMALNAASETRTGRAPAAGQQSVIRAIRTQLMTSGLSQEIDSWVRKLLPQHVESLENRTAGNGGVPDSHASEILSDFRRLNELPR